MSKIASSSAEAAIKASAEAAAKASAEAAAKSAAAVSEAAIKSSAAATARAAAKVAREVADNAAALVKKAVATGSNDAAEAARAVAKNADDAAEAAEAAAKNADDAAKAAAKNADDATKAAKSTAKNADDLAAVTGKSGKGVSKTTAAAVLASGAVLAGGILYVDKKLRDADENIKDCMKVCLPDNWDDYVYGENIGESELKYKEIDEDMGEQPLCNEKIKDCADFCEDKCTELHDADLPGGGIASRFKQAVEDIINPFKNIFKNMKGIGDIASIMGVGVLLLLIIGGGGFIVYKILTSSPRRSPQNVTELSLKDPPVKI